MPALSAKGVSPVNVLLSDLQSASHSAELLGSTGVLLTEAACVLASSVAITQVVSLRRG